jgi:hypothetical protein
MQCPSRIDRAITRLRFAKSFIVASSRVDGWAGGARREKLGKTDTAFPTSSAGALSGLF